MPLFLLSMLPLAATVYRFPENDRAAAVEVIIGGLCVEGVIFGILYLSHTLRMIVWGGMLLVTVCKIILVINISGAGSSKNFVLVLCYLGLVVFLLGIGWYGKTAEKSRRVLLLLLIPKAALVAFAIGLCCFSPA